jgi:hypothetical protein
VFDHIMHVTVKGIFWFEHIANVKDMKYQKPFAWRFLNIT